MRAGAGAGQGAKHQECVRYSQAVRPEAGPDPSQGFRVLSETGGFGEVSTGVCPSSDLVGVAIVGK